jgi:serine/threonine protein phosphatase PrpC
MAKNYFGITDTGRQRNNNEDSFIADRTDDGQFVLACVIDGVGGYEGGEVAAEIARAVILEKLKRIKGDPTPLMKQAFLDANEKIQQEKLKNPDHDRMACVLTLALVDQRNNEFYFAHVGDTRLYLFRDRTLVKVSKDHSFVGFLEDSGRLTEEAAMRHPKRNEINKALGFGHQITVEEDYIQTGHSPFLPNDMLLLCSDGLTDLVNREAITSILSSDKKIEEMASRLVALANEEGGKDNITVVLVRNDRAPVKQQATRPVLIKKKDQVADEPAPQPVKETVIEKKPVVLKKRTRTSAWTVILLLLCLALIGVVGWLLWKQRTQPKAIYQPPAVAATVHKKNEAEARLQDTLNNLQGDTLVLREQDFGSAILLSDSIRITRDTLYLKASGNIVLACDSSYGGPALIMTAANKSLVLDSILLDGFTTGIVAHDYGLRLKNVRFRNCGMPVMYGFSFTDNQYINGQLRPGNSFRPDSLPK